MGGKGNPKVVNEILKAKLAGWTVFNSVQLLGGAAVTKGPSRSIAAAAGVLGCADSCVRFGKSGRESRILAPIC